MKTFFCALLLAPAALFANTLSLNVLDNQVVDEGSETPGIVTLELSLTEPAGSPVQVSVQTADGQAVAGEDYQAFSETFIIPKGSSKALFQVYTLPDRDDEDYLEQFEARIVSASGAQVGKAVEIITIKDDDEVFEVEAFAQTVEGNQGETKTVEIKVSRKHDSPETVLVGFRTTGEGSAAEGEDYSAQYTTLGFMEGETEKTVSVNVQGDNKIEPHESFFVEIFSNDDNVSFSRQKGEVYIVDDEGDMVLSFDVKFNITNNGSLDVHMKGEIPLEKTMDADGNTLYRGQPQTFGFSNVWSNMGTIITKPIAFSAKLYAKNNDFSSKNMVLEWNVGMGAAPQCSYPTSGGRRTNFVNCIFWKSFKHVHRQRGSWKEPSLVVVKNFQGANGRSGNSYLVALKKQNFGFSAFSQQATFKILRREAN